MKRYYIIALLLSLFFVSNTVSAQEKYPVNTTTKGEGTIRVMSYNIHFCAPPTTNVADIDGTANVLAKQAPDLIALQEVDMNTSRSKQLNQAKELALRLGMNYFFAPAINVYGGTFGCAILSKYPMSDAVVHVLPRPDTSGENRVLGTAKITLPDGTVIRFGSTHFDLKTANKQAEIARVAEIADAEPLPFIIAGDLNSWENSGVIGTLDTKFTRTCYDCPLTSPVITPKNTIDYIAYRHPENKFTTVNHKAVNETYQSDHRPIVANIAYQGSEPSPYYEPTGILTEDFSSNAWETELIRINPTYITPPATGNNSYTSLNSTELYFGKYQLIGAIESNIVLPCASNSTSIEHNNNNVAVALRLKNDVTGMIELPEIQQAGVITIHARNGNPDNLTTMVLEKYENGSWAVLNSFSLTPNGAFQNVRDEVLTYAINSTTPIKLRIRNSGNRYINLYRISIGAVNQTSKVITPVIVPLKQIKRRLTSEKPVSISIYNLLGKLVYEKKNNTLFEIPASIGNGIFIVRSSQGYRQKIFL